MLQTRLQTLKEEFERGKQHLDTLDRERDALRETLLRISGAIQVLEELLAPERSPGTESVAPRDDELR